MNKTKMFFMVYNAQRSARRVKHPDYASAVAEAQRLAILQPGDEFFILQAVALVSAPKPPTPVPVVSPIHW